MGVHRIALVRHGQYDNVFGDDGELNATGKFQALLTGDALKEQLFDSVYVSPILRARQTAEIMFGSLNPAHSTADSRLEECVPSIPTRFADWFARNRPAMGEQQTVFCREKIERFYEEVFVSLAEDAPDRHTLVIAHGNVIRYLLCLSMEAGVGAWANMLVYHCSVSRVMIEPNGLPFVHSINDLSHLAPEFRSES